MNSYEIAASVIVGLIAYILCSVVLAAVAEKHWCEGDFVVVASVLGLMPIVAIMVVGGIVYKRVTSSSVGRLNPTRPVRYVYRRILEK